MTFSKRCYCGYKKKRIKNMGWDGTRTVKCGPGCRIECLKNDSHFLQGERISRQADKSMQKSSSLSCCCCWGLT